jgi:hypothetical protein
MWSFDAAVMLVSWYSKTQDRTAETESVESRERVEQGQWNPDESLGGDSLHALAQHNLTLAV